MGRWEVGRDQGGGGFLRYVPPEPRQICAFPSLVSFAGLCPPWHAGPVFGPALALETRPFGAGGEAHIGWLVGVCSRCEYLLGAGLNRRVDATLGVAGLCII